MTRVGEPVLVGRGLTFAEGVNFDRDGTLYYLMCNSFS